MSPAANASIDRLLRNPVLARSAPFALYIVFLAAAPLLRQLFPDFDGRWLYAVQIGVVAAALIVGARAYVELLDARRLKAGDWGRALLVGAVVFALWVNLEFPWAVIGDPGSEPPAFDPRRADGSLEWPLVLVRIFGAAVVVPVMEELFWRSFVMRWFDRQDFLRLAPAAVSLRAILVSSLVFGFEHSLWFAGIIAGLAYAWLYVRSGNLWLPIAAHATTNLLLGIMVVATGSWRFW